ncbi:hypothetical protein N6G05_26800 [Cupriavidus gilardii]|uniref:hypothetical protein n=1 Tax=Cupriavidus gilardii TaxID=82541 RepID=UPI0021C0E408|nr:hypothetical protein [Cupriavidus gilardii]MCT9017165.1 hypothetical protein [Cupriavidus gilardii]MCT9056828.1 hypothetical protein [Cupriavidus gilardii]
MATIDFLPFATGSGANVLSQAEWAALTQRLSGFQSGVAKSDQLNKAWRQSSIMAAVIAGFVADVTGRDVIDDGTTATILANLKAAVSAQSIGVVGSARNARMIVSTPSATATFTADEVVVESALGGLTYRLPNFSKTINLATTGAGGMDSGQAPASGFVAIYAIYNPSTGATALLANDATSAAQPEVYSGTAMPSGYTASALVSIAPTTSGRLLAPMVQRGRVVGVPAVSILSSSTGGTLLPVTSTAIPLNAYRIRGSMAYTIPVAATVNYYIYGDANSTDQSFLGFTQGAAGAWGQGGVFDCILRDPQRFYVTVTATAGAPTFGASMASYWF